MINLRKFGIVLIIFICFVFTQTNVSALQSANLISDLPKIDVEEFSTLYKSTVIGLVIINILVYKFNKIGDAMSDYFEKYTLTWISMGMLLCIIFNAVAADTDIYYEATFAGMGLIITPYYLYNQYQTAKPQNMTKSLWIRAIFLSLVDLAIIWFLPKAMGLIVILAQNVVLMLIESFLSKK